MRTPDHTPRVTLTIDTTALTRALQGFSAASQDACKAAMGLACASSVAREMAADAARNAELMERAQFITGKTAGEIRALAACSPLCFADFVQDLQNPPPDPLRALACDQVFDHYPFDDGMRIGLLHAIVDALALVSSPLPIPPVVQPNRFVKFGDSMVCTKCNLDARYCRGHAPPTVTAAQDAQVEASLERRVRECMGGK